MNLAQIRSAVPDRFECQTKKKQTNKNSQTALKTEPNLHAAKTLNV